MRDWIDRLLAYPGMSGMGHGQRIEDANLGLGWLYYSLGRILRPRCAVVIGSYRGFVPIVLARALKDNAEGGVVHFIDPSMVDDFWKKPESVVDHFASFGVPNIRHHLMTTEEFRASDDYPSLGDIGLLFVDGYHSREQARFDHRAFEDKMGRDAVVLFHDSMRERETRIYGDDRVYRHTVVRYMDELKSDGSLQVLDLPLWDGVTLVRRGAPEHAP